MTRICLCMIVKDEAHIVREALTSLLPYIHYWIVCDTGSTDDTPRVIQDFFAQHQVPGKMLYHSWRDFAHNRTLALESVRDSQDEHACDYVLMFDADDVLEGKLPLEQLACDACDACDAYHMKIAGHGFLYDRMCLFRCSRDLEWWYRGVVHECSECRNKPDCKVGWLMGDYHIVSRRMGARSRNSQKYLCDAQLLVKALDEGRDPDLAARYTFYAAQSYHDAGMMDHALVYYQKRMTMGGWQDEVYYAAFRMAGIVEAQCPNVYSEADVERAYLQAFKEGPHRAEPLCELARFYRTRKRYREAYAFAKLAQPIPSPLTAVPNAVHLFVTEDVYTFRVDDEVAVSAYWLGKKDECRMLCERLLERTDLSDETRTRIQQNHAFCV